MSRWLKIVFFLFLAGFIGFMGLCALGYHILMRSMPVTRGEKTLAGLADTVSVHRDDFHVPHILARTETDLYFAQGFVTAQERLWQMELWRHLSQGRLAEIVGPSGLPEDSLMRAVGIHRMARNIASRLPAESRTCLQAYADGVNAYLDAFGNKLPLEFNLLGHRPLPWKIIDTISIMRWLCWEASPSWERDRTLAKIVHKIGWSRARRLLPPGTAPSPELESIRWRPASRPSPRVASNAWAVSGDRTESGAPILAGDPLGAVSLPPFWFLVHLQGTDLDVLGLSIPGIPGIAMGRNRAIAWTFTDLGADDMDFVIEETDPTDFTRYRAKGLWRSMEAVSETLKVRGSEPAVMTVYETVHGPVIHSDPGRETPVLSLVWAGSRYSDEFAVRRRLMKARNWPEFREVLENYQTIPRQFIFAGTDGTIASQAAGVLFRRVEYSGRFPVPAGRFQHPPAFYSLTDFPPKVNPPEGWVAASGPEAALEKDSGMITEWRPRRVRQMLSADTVFTVRLIQDIGGDVISDCALDLLPRILEALTGSDMDAKANTVYDRMADWNGSMNTGSMEAAVFHVLLNQITVNIFKEELGDLYDEFLMLHTEPHEALFRLMVPSTRTDLDGMRPYEQREDLRTLIRRSYLETLEILADRMGDDPSRWTWGHLHTLIFKHPLGRHSLLDRTLNLGPFPVKGSAFTLFSSGHMLNDPYAAVWSPSARFIADLSDPDNTRLTLPTGQSGQPMDPHYKDQLPLYLTERSLGHLMTRKKILAQSWDVLTLIPGGTP
ncbi:MAG TPA: penicillin acylase family protein [bacterium]|nr:penicillin acylase family protein [bacterium]